MMKKTLLILALLLSRTVLLSAQDLSAEQMKAAILKFSAKVTAIDCDFTQTKESPLLSNALVSSGQMKYRKGGYLEWSYIQPTPISIIVDGNRISLTKDGKTQTLGSNQARLVGEMSRMISDNIEGNALLNEDLFEIKYNTGDGRIVVSFMPKKKEMQKIWSKLLLYYEQNSMKVTNFELYEAGGGLTRINFSKIRYEFSE